MNYCTFVPTDQQHVYRCTVCQRTWRCPRHGPAAMHRECQAGTKIRGLGDTVAKLTAALGIQHCEGCERRRELLNELVPYN